MEGAECKGIGLGAGSGLRLRWKCREGSPEAFVSKDSSFSHVNSKWAA